MGIGAQLEFATREAMAQGASKPSDPAVVAARKEVLDRHLEQFPEQGKGPQLDRAVAMFPSTKEKLDWVEFFDRRPDVLHAILGDFYRFTKVHEAEVKKTGRRPKAVNGNLDELHSMLTPRYSHKPFAESVRELMGRQSLRQFSAKIPMHHHQLTRLMTGERAIVKEHDPAGSMQLLETIARAGKVGPAYFMEWRQLFVWAVLQEVLTAKPNVSIALVERLKRAREDT